MEALARRALARSRALGWHLLDLPAQLRISTIDSFCRDLGYPAAPALRLSAAISQIDENPHELYRRAAPPDAEQIDGADAALSDAIEDLLLWRDNNWNELEDLLVEMLGQRDRWMHDFVLEQRTGLGRSARRVLNGHSPTLFAAPSPSSTNFFDQVPRRAR